MISSKFVQLCSKRSLSTSKHIVISDKVRNALQNGEPIVALESTIITHGMPQPHNIQCAKRVEEIVEQNVIVIKQFEFMAYLIEIAKHGTRSSNKYFCIFLLFILGCHTGNYSND